MINVGCDIELMTILITGGTGALGNELKNIFSNDLFPSHNELDVTNKKMVSDFFTNNDIDTVIHTAAITSVRLCEENKQLAWDTNLEGTKNLVNAVIDSPRKIKFVYLYFSKFNMNIRKINIYFYCVKSPVLNCNVLLFWLVFTVNVSIPTKLNSPLISSLILSVTNV